MKKLIYLCVLLTLSLTVNAVEVEIDGLWYNVVTKAGEAEVIKYKNEIEYSGAIVIPETINYEGTSISVTSIGNYAFYGCHFLTSVTIPNSVTSIGQSAFYLCSGLTSVTIPNSVSFIEDKAFYKCSSLTSVTIPNSVTSIGFNAFGGCSSLTFVHITDLAAWMNVYFYNEDSNPLSYAHHLFLDGEEIKELNIPNTVTRIRSYAFCSCIGLTSITIPNSVSSIGGYAFCGCSGLTSVTIPNSVSSIGYSTFSGCSGLTSVTIPNSVSFIEDKAFYQCSALKELSIGTGIKNIYGGAFGKCEELTDVYCYAVGVPFTLTGVFDGSYIEYATLHVPDESIQKYGAAEPWKNFKTIIGLNGASLPEMPKCAMPTIAYVDGKLLFECETEDVTFVSTVTSSDFTTNYDSEVPLTASYTVTVYATKNGYNNSDEATYVINWREGGGMHGDVNGDGQVGIADIVNITSIMAGKE